MLQLLEFTAQWCGPCKRIHPDVMDLVEQYPKVDFKSIDADKSPDLFELWNVHSLPTFVLWLPKEQKECFRIQGANVPALRKAMEEVCND